MKRVFLLLILLGFSASYALAQDALNASRMIEIGWPQAGYQRLGGDNFISSGIDVAVRVTDSVAVVGELRSAINTDVTDSIISYRGGVRFNRRPGNRMTTFVQALGGGTTGLVTFFEGICNNNGCRFNQSSSGSALSFAVGGGVDIGLKTWLAVRVIQADWEMSRLHGTTSNGVRLTGGLVFRLGE